MIPALKLMTKGAYDLQALRIQTGLRLYANFRNKLQNQRDTDDPDELSAAAESLIVDLRAEYVRLTDGVAKNRTLPPAKGFSNEGLISEYSELVLVDQYTQLERQERRQFKQMADELENVPIFTEYLSHVVGIGPALAAVLITCLDPAKARHVSSFWKYAGLDVAADNYGRSKRKEHLIDVKYVDREGHEQTRVGITYNPWLKSKLLGVMAGSFLRSGSPWRETYDNYKHRLETDPGRVKMTSPEKVKRNKAGEDTKHVWTPGRIHKAALRYMVKMFLAEFWAKWRAMEGLAVTPTYHEAKLGHVHGGHSDDVLRSEAAE